MKRTSKKSSHEVWDALGAYTGKSSPPLYRKLKAQHFVERFEHILKRQDGLDPEWDEQFTEHVSSYLSKHAADVVSVECKEAYNAP